MPVNMTEEEALSRHSCAQELQNAGFHLEAVRYFTAAAEYFAAAEGPASPDLANVLTDCAESLLATCRYLEAEEMARRSNQIMEGICHLLDQHSRGLLMPRVLAVWGRSLRELGLYEDAAVSLRKAISVCEECLGREYLGLTTFLNEYGVLCKYRGHFEEAQHYYLRALRMLEGEFGEGSRDCRPLSQPGWTCSFRRQFCHG